MVTVQRGHRVQVRPDVYVGKRLVGLYTGRVTHTDTARDRRIVWIATDQFALPLVVAEHLVRVISEEVTA
ncbi:hypothetical protein H0B56_12265 [Haloechinothrix sp. YIM 98757]|uniref:Uncharacterized protein n=1 Tax=Haloechinothrix aidingensis TaxID=2752311 RepID=A0A838AAS0_9PSEU|nr:hypothetical protein [Haloechinothrix aidingensis]MBA0126317.1 hypothetical protein [Haloechinothrix aidingensis]